MDRLSRLAYNAAHSDIPGVRAAFASIVAKVDPPSAKAFSDVAIDAKLNAFMQKLENEKLQERMATVQNLRESQKQEVIRKRGYNADQVKALEAIQSQYGLTDWGATADIYATRHPPDDPRLKPPPDQDSGAAWDFPTVPGPDGKMLTFKDYIQDTRRHSNRVARQMIGDFMRKRLPPAFHGA